MTYFIIRDSLIIIYYFIIYTKILNKTSSQTRCPKVKNVTDFGTEGVVCANRRNIFALIFLITLCIKVNLMIYKMLFMIDFGYMQSIKLLADDPLSVGRMTCISDFHPLETTPRM